MLPQHAFIKIATTSSPRPCRLLLRIELVNSDAGSFPPAFSTRVRSGGWRSAFGIEKHCWKPKTTAAAACAQIFYVRPLTPQQKKEMGTSVARAGDRECLGGGEVVRPELPQETPPNVLCTCVADGRPPTNVLGADSKKSQSNLRTHPGDCNLLPTAAAGGAKPLTPVRAPPSSFPEASCSCAVGMPMLRLAVAVVVAVKACPLPTISVLGESFESPGEGRGRQAAE